MTADEKAAAKVENAEETKVDADIKPAPDGGYGWVVLVGSFLISFILDGVMYSFGLIYNEIKTFYGAPNDVAGLIISFNTGFLFCSGPIVAGLANQFGCRTVVMGGAIVTSLMYFITVFAPNIYIIMATYGIIGGLSTGCTYIASLIIIADYFDKKRGIATGITMAGSGVGSFVFAPLIEYLIRNFDWKFATSICSCIILQTCVCGALLRPLNSTPSSSSSKPKQVELKSLKNAAENGSKDENAPNVVQTFSGSVYSINKISEDLPFYQRNKFVRICLGILKEMTDFGLLRHNFPFLLITLSNFFIFSGYFLPFLFITKIAESNGIENASLLISIIGIVNIPFRMLFGLVADKRYISPVNLNTLAVFISTVPLFFYKVLQFHFWTQAVFAFFFAVGIAGMNSLTTMYLVDIVGLKKFGNATGIVNLFRGFGCFLGPALGGYIADKFGNAQLLVLHTFVRCTARVAAATAVSSALRPQSQHLHPQHYYTSRSAGSADRAQTYGGGGNPAELPLSVSGPVLPLPSSVAVVPPHDSSDSRRPRSQSLFSSLAPLSSLRPRPRSRVLSAAGLLDAPGEDSTAAAAAVHLAANGTGESSLPPHSGGGGSGGAVRASRMSHRAVIFGTADFAARAKRFWNWPTFTPYVVFCMGFFSVLACAHCFVKWIAVLRDRESLMLLYGDLIGALALGIEAFVPLPQAWKNYKRQSTAGISMILVLSWAAGDMFKTIYFSLKDVRLQFLLCAIFQVCIDSIILMQIAYYTFFKSRSSPLASESAYDYADLPLQGGADAESIAYSSYVSENLSEALDENASNQAWLLRGGFESSEKQSSQKITPSQFNQHQQEQQRNSILYQSPLHSASLTSFPNQIEKTATEAAAAAAESGQSGLSLGESSSTIPTLAASPWIQSTERDLGKPGHQNPNESATSLEKSRLLDATDYPAAENLKKNSPPLNTQEDNDLVRLLDQNPDDASFTSKLGQSGSSASR